MAGYNSLFFQKLNFYRIFLKIAVYMTKDAHRQDFLEKLKKLGSFVF